MKKSGLLIFLFLIILRIQPSKAEIKWVDSLQILSPEQGATFDSLPIKFVWKKHPKFSTYSIEISTDSLFKRGCTHTVTDSTFTYTSDLNSCMLAQGSRYYWRVRYHFDDSGYTRMYKSASRTFTILPTDLRKPIIYLPEERTHVDSANVLFRWSFVKGAVSYKLYAFDYGTPGKTLINTIVTDTSYEMKNVPMSDYLVQVSAIDTAQVKYASSLIMFNTGYKEQGIPVLLTPPDSSTNVSTDVLLTWDPKIFHPSELSHRFYLSIYKEPGELSRNSELVVDTFWLEDSFYYFSAEANTKYYWHVKNPSNYPIYGYSSYYSFITGDASSVSKPAGSYFDLTPNPILQNTVVRLHSSVSPVRILITDILGNRVKSINDNRGPDIMIDFSDIKGGVYFLEVEYDGFVGRKKVVKF